jgi:hypothetical protein
MEVSQDRLNPPDIDVVLKEADGERSSEHCQANLKGKHIRMVK